MLKLRDISLKKRILLTNFLMIALPVGFLLVLGGLLFAGLKTTGTIRDAELALLWQDKREALSIQLAVSSLKAKADRGKKVSEMEADCRALERQGIESLIAKNGEIVYASPSADPQELLQDVQILANGSRSFLRWDERGLALLYRAEKTRTVVIARGRIPFHARAPKEEDPLHDVWEILAYIFLAAMAIVITALGRYLARLLSEQILSPLEKLKTTAAATLTPPPPSIQRTRSARSAAPSTSCGRRSKRKRRDAKSMTRTARNSSRASRTISRRP